MAVQSLWCHMIVIFLDEVVTKIWSIEEGKLIEHNGHYSSYMAAREQQRLAQQRAYDKQQKKY